MPIRRIFCTTVFQRLSFGCPAAGHHDSPATAHATRPSTSATPVRPPPPAFRVGRAVPYCPQPRRRSGAQPSSPPSPSSPSGRTLRFGACPIRRFPPTRAAFCCSSRPSRSAWCSTRPCMASGTCGAGRRGRRSGSGCTGRGPTGRRTGDGPLAPNVLWVSDAGGRGRGPPHSLDSRGGARRRLGPGPPSAGRLPRRGRRRARPAPTRFGRRPAGRHGGRQFAVVPPSPASRGSLRRRGSRRVCDCPRVTFRAPASPDPHSDVLPVPMPGSPVDLVEAETSRGHRRLARTLCRIFRRQSQKERSGFFLKQDFLSL